MPCKNENLKGEKHSKYNFFNIVTLFINMEKWKSPEFLKNGGLSADCVPEVLAPKGSGLGEEFLSPFLHLFNT